MRQAFLFLSFSVTLLAQTPVIGVNSTQITSNPGGPVGNGCQNWQALNPILPVLDAGLSRTVHTKPASESRRIVILGSSTARGLGASNCLTTSWAAQFNVGMAAKGYTVINVAHEGDNSTALINRFYTDVAPYVPDFVVLAGSIYNDGSPTAGNINFHEQSVARLIKMVEGIGAIPVVVGQWPNDTYTLAQYQMSEDLYSQLEKLGVQTWDFMSGTLDATNGHFLSAVNSVDGTHPGDAGHAVMYQSIPLSYFDVAYTKHSTSEVPLGEQYWSWGSDTTNLPLSVTPFPSLASFTASFWARDNGGAGSAFWSSNRDATNPLRIRSNSGTGVFELVDGNTTVVASVISGTARLWHHHAVAYNALTNSARYYIDGALIGTGPLTRTNFNTGTMTFLSRFDSPGGNCIGCQLAGPTIHRAPLQTQDIVSLYNGHTLRKSLEWYSTLGNTPGTYAPNLADTGTQGTLGPTWTIGGPFNIVQRSNAFTGTKTAGSCVMTFVNGLVTAVTGC